MELNIRVVLKTVLEDHTLPLNGDHGVAHWATSFGVVPTFVKDEWEIDLELEKKGPSQFCDGSDQYA